MVLIDQSLRLLDRKFLLLGHGPLLKITSRVHSKNIRVPDWPSDRGQTLNKWDQLRPRADESCPEGSEPDSCPSDPSSGSVVGVMQMQQIIRMDNARIGIQVVKVTVT